MANSRTGTVEMAPIAAWTAGRDSGWAPTKASMRPGSGAPVAGSGARAASSSRNVSTVASFIVLDCRFFRSFSAALKLREKPSTHSCATMSIFEEIDIVPIVLDVFLSKQLHRQTPSALALHLIVDNYATHKHALVRAWLEAHPRVHVHFTPTGSSWMNLVERFFRQITDDVVRDGSFASVGELVTAINVHLAHHNLKPTPYRWKAEGAAILEKIQRARAAQAKSGL